MKNIPIIAYFLGMLLFIHTTAKAQKSIDEKFNDIDEIEIKGGFCDVVIVGSNQSQTTLSATISGSGDKNYELEYEKIGSRLTVFLKDNKKNGKWKNENLQGVIKIETNRKNKITATTSSGDIGINNFKDNTFTIASTSGSISATELDGTINIASTSGNINLENSKGTISTKNTSGNQCIKDSEGNIVAKNTSGDIELSQFVGTATAENTSGGITIKAVEASLKLVNTSGGIRGEQVKVTNHSTFAATSGDIDIQFSNKIEDLNFELKSSSGNIKGIGSKKQSGFSSDGGTINSTNTSGKYTIKGVTSSGSQNYTN
ncbi:MAG: hypothetical protein EAZ55_01815 [Cytophagales bacterium]|nr:MAG: hypothetical protein EAZ55_01815 [Cytophagales bacterium]